MSTPPSYVHRDRQDSLALLREGMAVGLLLAGVVGLIVTGFLFSLRAGLGVSSVVLIAAGVGLGYRPDDTSRTRR